MTPAVAAKERFDTYAGMSGEELPSHLTALSALQVNLCRWQNRNFNGGSIEQMVLGATEELGELAHAVLKHSQAIRGMSDMEAFRAAAGDAIADCSIYLMQLSTMLRLDYGEIVCGTAREVMQRDWVKYPDGGLPKPGACDGCGCGEELGDRSYSDVPDEGDLCILCHDKWRAAEPGYCGCGMLKGHPPYTHESLL